MQSIKIRNFINSPPKPETHAIKKNKSKTKHQQMKEETMRSRCPDNIIILLVTSAYICKKILA